MRQNGITSVDLLLIDAEGFDGEIVRMALAEGLQPAILAFEWDHLDQRAMWDCRCMLINAGYKWLTIKGDIVAAHESLLQSQ